jgi:hypothetical protein
VSAIAGVFKQWTCMIDTQSNQIALFEHFQYTGTQRLEQTEGDEESKACMFNDDRIIRLESKGMHSSGHIFSLPDLMHHLDPNQARCVPMSLESLD